MIYGTRANGNEHGVVLTKNAVVEKMLDLTGYVPTENLSKTRIIEPAAGEGAFALPILRRLFESSQNYNFDFQKALSQVQFFELDEKSMKILKENVKNLLQEFNAFTTEKMFEQGDFLEKTVEKSDIVIGNPPYVRHENIPKLKKEFYRRNFKTFTHRSDIYIAFFEKGLSLLKKGGKLSFICSNRWLKNQYGEQLRKLISRHFWLREVIDLEEVDVFEESVIAYPAITTIFKTKKNTPTQYFKLSNLNDLLLFSNKNQPTSLLNLDSKNWFVKKSGQTKLDENLDSIINQGFKIGIGVATGKDSVFIKKDFKNFVEEELLLPILLSKDLRGGELNWQGNYLLNPFDKQGFLIDLEKYPKAKAFFHQNEEALKNRYVAKKNPKKWYKTIDKIDSKLVRKPKILLPDISGNKSLFIDEGKFYPHHNLYFITGKSTEELMVLAAILMSDFIKNQLNEVSTKMNGGYVRWQSQNLKKLRVPKINSIPKTDFSILMEAYRNKNLSRINSLISEERIAQFKSIDQGQLSLFRRGVNH